ncbi:MAG: hypothetical protein K9M44_02985 [Candidatus Pacebacteria bacterium]|nr:hypothetical protein [Candidatus Paceibacterota bacterium]
MEIMAKSSVLKSTQLATQIIWEFLYFPIWWYSVGWWRFGRFLYAFLSWQQASLGFYTWLKNIFVPMYGQTDFAGRMISFLIRVVQIMARGLAMLILLLLALFLFIFWAALPLLVVYGILFQLI